MPRTTIGRETKAKVSELDPGASGTPAVVLKPGKYLLICNVAGHY
jgi:uncharacterized cupredoxin-like copper-binding protein